MTTTHDAIDPSQITCPPKTCANLVNWGSLVPQVHPLKISVRKAGGWHSTEIPSYLLILSCEVCKFRLLSDDLLLLLIIIQFFTIF